MEHADEISNAITAANLGEQVDDDELLAELDQMAQEELDERMLGAPAAPITATPGTVKPGMLFFPFLIFFCRLLFPVEDVWLTRALCLLQWPYQRRQWKTTRRRSYGSCRPRWQCRQHMHRN